MLPLQTAEVVAARYNVSREYQDQYSLQSQQRTAAAQAAGAFDDEIVPVEATMAVKDKATGEIVKRSVRLDHDEGNRPETTIEDLRSLKPVVEGGIVTAGNASQWSDVASACVAMEAKTEERRGFAPLGGYFGMRMVGTTPHYMCVGHGFAE